MDIILVPDDYRQTPLNDDRQTSPDDDRQTPPDDDRQTPPDDDRQTSSSDQSSTDDTFSEPTENLLPVYDDDQQQISSMSTIHVSPVKVNNQNSTDDIFSEPTENLLPVCEDDQQQTSTMNNVRVSPVKVNNQSSTDDIFSEPTENLLPVYEDDQQQISSMNSIRVCPVKVNCSSLPNLKIKHPYQLDDSEKDPFNDKKRIIIDEHVKVSHINRSNLRRLTTDIVVSRLKPRSSRKSAGSVTVSRANKILFQSVNANLNNQQIMPMTSRQSTVRVSRISTAANNMNQGFHQKVIASKPIVTRLSASNERPFKMKQKELHVIVKHLYINSKKSS
jgi:hypothetical protein